MSTKRSRGFALVELPVVIAIIATLFTMLLPALSAAREDASRASCQDNLNNNALAVVKYAELIGCCPVGVHGSDPTELRASRLTEENGASSCDMGIGWATHI